MTPAAVALLGELARSASPNDRPAALAALGALDPLQAVEWCLTHDALARGCGGAVLGRIVAAAVATGITSASLDRFGEVFGALLDPDVLADLAGREGSGKPGGTLIDTLLAERGARPVDFTGWQKINAAEVAAGQGRPREKLARFEELLSAAKS